jgi:hypothetical protein
VLKRVPPKDEPIAALFSALGSSFRGHNSRLRWSQGIAVLQIKRAQCAFDGVAKPNNSVLHIAAEQNKKGVALPEDLRSSHGTGTAWVIDKVLLHLKNSFVVAVHLSIQRVKLLPIHPNR